MPEMLDLAAFKSELSGHGVDSVIELAIDDQPQLTIVHAVDGVPSRRFAVAFRTEGAFILGFRGAFLLNCNADPSFVVRRIANEVFLHPDSTFYPNVFDLTSYPYNEWLKNGGRRLANDRLTNGWILVPEQESKQLWTAFTDLFEFNWSLRGHKEQIIKQPAPFVTWSLSKSRKIRLKDRAQFDEFERQSRKELLQTLKSLGPKSCRMYAMDLNHPTYSFNPTVVAERWSGEVFYPGCDVSWPISIINEWNYSLFVNDDFSLGLFCHPHEPSVCVFGELLVERMLKSELSCFGGIIRSSSRTSN